MDLDIVNNSCFVHTQVQVRAGMCLWVSMHFLHYAAMEVQLGLYFSRYASHTVQGARTHHQQLSPTGAQRL